MTRLLSSSQLPGALLLAFIVGCTGGDAPAAAPEATAQEPEMPRTEEFLGLRQAAASARAEVRPEDAIRLLRRAQRLSPDHPTINLQLAELYASTGNAGIALEHLERIVAGGVSIDLYGSADLGPLEGDPGFAAVLEGMRTNRTPVAGAETVCAFDAPGLTPEGIDFDPIDRRIVLGSFTRGELVTSDLDCRTRVLLPAGSLGAVAGVRVDPQRRLVWATSNSREDRTPVPTIVAVSLQTGEILARKEIVGPVGEAGLPSPLLLNDIAITRDGSVFVTESMHGALLRTCRDCPGLAPYLPPGSLPMPNGITTDPDSRLYVAHAGGVSRIDTNTGEHQWIETPHGVVALGGDGIYWHDGSLLVVQNQPFHDRVARLWLNVDGRSVERVRVLNARHPGGLFHSTGFVLDGYFYMNGVPGDVPPPPELEGARPLLLSMSLGTY